MTDAPADFPEFDYHGVVLHATGLRYAPHPDIIHPSVFATSGRIPDAGEPWLMYYAPHDAPGGICLATAAHPAGPWREHPGNPVLAADWSPHHRVSHVSSPHAIWHEGEQRMFLYYHGENDSTRFATSTDGIHFEYGGLAVDTSRLEPGVTEASYARVFPWKEGFFMNLMGNHNGTRKIYRAFSKDGRHWQVPPAAWISPPPGYGQMGPGSLIHWQDEPWLICFGNREDAPELDPVSDLLLYKLDADLNHAEYRGVLMSRETVGPDNLRINDPCLLETEDELYLYVNVGRRLNQEIGLAVMRRFLVDRVLA